MLITFYNVLFQRGNKSSSNDFLVYKDSVLTYEGSGLTYKPSELGNTTLLSEDGSQILLEDGSNILVA